MADDADAVAAATEENMQQIQAQSAALDKFAPEILKSFLEGASWDHERGCLRKQLPKVLVEELPILQVIPIEASKLKLANTFKTPVYGTQARRNAMGKGMVFEADVRTREHISHW